MDKKLLLLIALALVVHPGLDWLVDLQFGKQAETVRVGHAQ